MQRGASAEFVLVRARFLIIAPGITIKDRLRILLPSDPNGYYYGHYEKEHEAWKRSGKPSSARRATFSGG